jgi:ubiquinone/menaquinone biosynthesis C-methylase UbiE
MDSLLTAENLRLAAAEVRKGWCQFVLEDDADRVCALGAIKRVLTRNGRTWTCDLADFPPEILALASALHINLDPRRWGYEIAQWNNDEKQTVENVALAFEYAAVLCLQQVDVRDVEGVPV